MRTTVELPDNLFRKAKARAALQGRALKDLIAEALKLLLQTSVTPKGPGKRGPAREAAASRGVARKRGSAATWAREFAGVASLPPGETTDDARTDHYRKKYGV
jgi:hypothetical protein